LLKNICKSILILVISILIFFIVQQLKNSQFKKSIIKEIHVQIGSTYNITNNIRRYVGVANTDAKSRISQNSFKLVYEMNFDCSLCLEELKKINCFYSKLNNIYEISLFLIATEKSSSYIEYYIDQSLNKYDLWVVQQEFNNDNYRLYLIDNFNKIVMAGDIIKYPFLQNEYINKLEMLAARGR
jgi:hypothetical protein